LSLHLVELCQESLKNNENNIETYFACEDGDSDYSHMDVTHLDILTSLLKKMETLIISLVMKVLRNRFFSYYVLKFKIMFHVSCCLYISFPNQ